MLSRVDKAFRLNLLASRMRAFGCFPRFIETSICGGFKVVNAFDSEGSSSVMHPDSCTGLSACEYTASLKALTEWLERRLVRSNPAAFPHWTDGTAGWDVPTRWHRDSAKRNARNHAVAEACERNIWSRWFDDQTIGQRVIEGQDLTALLSPASAAVVQYLSTLLPGGKLVAVVPHSSEAFPYRLIFGAYILAGDAGVVTGGAAAPPGRESEALEHGLTELVRHALALKQSSKKQLTAATVYEQRLLWMASPAGFAALAGRLANASALAEVSLPTVALDQVVGGVDFPFMAFHQFNFVDHPAFIGTQVERLCL